MAQSYAQIQKQIASLQRQAEAIRQGEIKGVVDRIKVAIAHYALTPEQLFETPKTGKPNKLAPTTASSVKFADNKGNVWSGRGPRPRWLRDALAAGASIDDYKPATGIAVATHVLGGSGKPARKVKRAPSKVLYGDDTGNTWTGRGPKPGWVKSALAAGKDLADLVK
jgi:DNA-binding protein H-NS